MIQIYDSQVGSKVNLEKKPGETISMYVCGPTVYDNAHLGHGRSAVAFDIIRRGFQFFGHPVTFVFNITDIEDKMITRAAEEGISVPELAERIIPEYTSDYGALGILEPTHKPLATEYIQQMLEIIKTLEEKGHTYVLEDGVYFDITTFAEYGKLSHQKLDELEAGSRVEERSDKRNHQDFVLWKLKKEGEPFWPSPWGEGRPGWHIECSAMSGSILGKTFDIHGGGLDLKFPHHECEIAQSESANGVTFAKHWMHNGYITVNDEKMSKSLGNFFTLKDIFKEYHPRVVRFFLLGTHYRSPIEFNRELLDQARNTLRNLDEFYLKHSEGGVDDALIQKVKEKIGNDFDVAGTLASIFEWMKSSPTDVRGTLDAINELLNIFPINFEVTQKQRAVLKERDQARAEKNWARSDEIRDQLAEQGLEVEDGTEASFLRPKI
jgi:cysteinyl-tRNA synthetase